MSSAPAASCQSPADWLAHCEATNVLAACPLARGQRACCMRRERLWCTKAEARIVWHVLCTINELEQVVHERLALATLKFGGYISPARAVWAPGRLSWRLARGPDRDGVWGSLHSGRGFQVKGCRTDVDLRLAQQCGQLSITWGLQFAAKPHVGFIKPHTQL